jgi:integrase
VSGLVLRSSQQCAVRVMASYGRGLKVSTMHLYPPVPELPREETQHLGDPALFAIIRNGILFTGMPASDLKDVEIAQVVAFLRGLPKLSDADIDQLKRGRATSSAAEHKTGSALSRGKGREPRDLGLSRVLLERMRVYWRWRRPKDWLFPSRPRPQHPMGDKSIPPSRANAERRSGIHKHVHSHVFPHSYAAHLLDVGTLSPVRARS